MPPVSSRTTGCRLCEELGSERGCSISAGKDGNRSEVGEEARAPVAASAAPAPDSASPSRLAQEVPDRPRSTASQLSAKLQCLRGSESARRVGRGPPISASSTRSSVPDPSAATRASTRRPRGDFGPDAVARKQRRCARLRSPAGPRPRGGGSLTLWGGSSFVGFDCADAFHQEAHWSTP